MLFEAMKAPSGLRADTGRSYQDIEREALDVRHLIASDFSMDQAPHGVTILDRIDQHKVLGGRVGLEVAIAQLPAGILGQTAFDPARNRIIISFAEGTNELFEADDGRARFTFAHELGHAFLHTHELVRQGELVHQMAALYRGEPLHHEKFQDTEWQADAFAAAFLMPAMGLELLARKLAPFELTAETVAQVFKVSNQAASYRLNNFKLRRPRLLYI